MSSENTDQLYSTVSTAFTQYKTEDSGEGYSDAELEDVYVVGSAVHGGFEPGTSDLDLCVLLSNVDNDVLLGFDVFLMECRQQELLQAGIDGAVKVDVGVYNIKARHAYIDDEQAYSCRTQKIVSVGDEPNL